MNPMTLVQPSDNPQDRADSSQITGQPHHLGTAGSRTTIYDVARVAGVAPSTVSRALSHPGRVSFRTAEQVRQVAEDLRYRTTRIQSPAPQRSTSTLAMVVADIANPVFHGMIRGAQRTCAYAGYTLIILETRESDQAEHDALQRLLPNVDGVILTSSRMSDNKIREVAKQKPLVTLDRVVRQVASVTSDNTTALKTAAKHLADSGVRVITYLAGPDGSRADGTRWLGLRQACLQIGVKVKRIGPLTPTVHGGAVAADEWLQHPTNGVVAYTDLIAVGFIRTIAQAGVRVPQDVRVVGFDNTTTTTAQFEPRLTTIAAPFLSLGSAAVQQLLKGRRRYAEDVGPLWLPARLVTRDTTVPNGRPEPR
ncbi:MAG TPA: LacI family DNA-binding transcriptional regulator [Propionibacteriaceae bacterium]|nr:LacI family DNA-binding transcriptional regulator [Propionibacteriaceae bacterium]